MANKYYIKPHPVNTAFLKTNMGLPLPNEPPNGWIQVKGYVFYILKFFNGVIG